MDVDLWRWPYVFEVDRQGFARVPIPVEVREFLRTGQEVAVFSKPSGGLNGLQARGKVTEFNKIAWIARVQIFKDSYEPYKAQQFD